MVVVVDDEGGHGVGSGGHGAGLRGREIMFDMRFLTAACTN